MGWQNRYYIGKRGLTIWIISTGQYALVQLSLHDGWSTSIRQYLHHKGIEGTGHCNDCMMGE